MAIIGIEEKRKLSELLAEGHRVFGEVKPRRAYKEDDEGGGAGTAEFLFETHPLLAEQPVGASSDLTFLNSESSFSADEAEKREDQASPQLKKQLQNSLGKSHAHTHRTAPTPTAG